MLILSRNIRFRKHLTVIYKRNKRYLNKIATAIYLLKLIMETYKAVLNLKKKNLNLISKKIANFFIRISSFLVQILKLAKDKNIGYQI